jgi:calcineurin-like phosphoesterase family protein
MYNVFYISDTHLGHENIVKLCRPEFKDHEEMVDTIVENWNKVVKTTDVVYHGGDFLWKHPPKPWNEESWAKHICRRLNGRIRLMLGNHDNPEVLIKNDLVESIQAWGVFKKERFCMTHFPIALPQCPPGFVNVHGHVHTNDNSSQPHQLNICVEKSEYAPIPHEAMKIAVNMTRNVMSVGSPND